jgi:hypothetical protein
MNTKVTQKDKENSLYHFEIVTLETAKEAYQLIIDNVNLIPEDNNPLLELEEAASPGKHTIKLFNENLVSPKYWILKYHDKIVGLTGYWFNPNDSIDTVWGGWTVIHKSIKSGLSHMKFELLFKLAKELKNSGKKILKLDTTDSKEMKQVNKYHDKMDFKIFKKVKSINGIDTIIFREGSIENICKKMKVE